jgi:hypothetical protein
MSIRLTSLRRHRWLASFLALAFVLRALIPAGFMPGGNGPLPLQICPDGFPAALLAAPGDHSAHAGHHHHQMSGVPDSDAPAPTHDHRSWSAGHCVFSAVAGAPPLSFPPMAAFVAETQPARVPTRTPSLSLDIRFRIAQPRAPPHLA